MENVLQELQRANSKISAITSEMSVLDKDWVRSRFVVPDLDLDEAIRPNRYVSTASLKFTDSSLGGNITVNPRPQHTRYADIRSRNLLTGGRRTTLLPTVHGVEGNNRTSGGMGNFYSESLDDNQQAVFLQAGVARFNSLTTTMANAIDYNTAVAANTGAPSMGYTFGKVIGGLGMLAAFPLITLSVWAIKKVFELYQGFGSYNYYYLEPKQHMYWGVVNTIVTELAVESGLLHPKFLPPERTESDGVNVTRIGLPVELNQADVDEVKELMPGLIGDGNYIDVYAIATRSQTLANAQKIAEYEFIQEGVSVEGKDLMPDAYRKATLLDAINYYTTFGQYLGAVNERIATQPKGDAPVTKTDTDVVVEESKTVKDSLYNMDNNGAYITKADPDAMRYTKDAVDAFDSAIRQGGAYAIFAVDYTGSVSESFSNSTSRINTGDAIKQVSMKSRDIKFDLAGGNIVPGMGDIMSTVKNVMAGALDSVTFGLSNVIATAAGGAFIDLPLKWDDSSMSLPTITYSMDLMIPYSDVYSRITGQYIPLAMILAFILPLGTGKMSYTSPFLCSSFCKGIQNIKLGMMVEATIERGMSNLGFDKSRNPLGMRITFKIADFSTLITAPVNVSVFSNLFNVGLADDTPFGNYMTVVGGRDILVNKYSSQQAKLKLSKTMMRLEQAFSASSMGMMAGNSLDGILGAVMSSRSFTGNFLN